VPIEIRRDDHLSLSEYALIAAAFDVREAVDRVPTGRAAMPLPRRVVHRAFRKDYDAIPGNGPAGWRRRFAVDRAYFMGAYDHGRRVGGAVAIVEPSDVMRLGGEPRSALLWDIRVAPSARRNGIGRMLLAAAEAAAQAAGCNGIVAETQDINVAACQLYAHAGYIIARVDPNAYPELPMETRIVWAKAFDVVVASGERTPQQTGA
jgi:ribosomal protein S18 acetylase RimI-like enzyme